jgi:hypothetical protein
MFKRVLFVSVLAAQLLTISTIKRTDDPFPCPDCGKDGGPPPSVLDLRADDPFPCPDCGKDGGPPPSFA